MRVSIVMNWDAAALVNLFIRMSTIQFNEALGNCAGFPGCGFY